MTDEQRAILEEFIAELEDNISTAVCNGTLRAVVFDTEPRDGKKSLQQIKEEFLCRK